MGFVPVVAGAGFDVLTTEPPKNGNILLDPTIPNLIITPHVAVESVKLSEAVVDFWCENVRRFAENETLLGVMDRQAGY